METTQEVAATVAAVAPSPGGRTIDELQEMVASMEAQLVALYASQESDGAGATREADHRVFDTYEKKLERSQQLIAVQERTIEALRNQLVEGGETPVDSTAADSAADTIASLEAQLQSFYAMHEGQAFDAESADANGDSEAAETIASLEAQLQSFYAAHEGQAFDASGDSEAAETIASLEAQLQSFYAAHEGQAFDASGDSEASETIASLEAQLQSFYAAHEGQAFDASGDSEAAETIASLEAQLQSFYAAHEGQAFDASGSGDSAETIASLEAQLQSFYSLFEGMSFDEVAKLRRSVESMNQQLCLLYAERSAGRIPSASGSSAAGELQSMVDSLEAQVAVLIEERDELASQVSTFDGQRALYKRRVAQVLETVVESSLLQ